MANILVRKQDGNAPTTTSTAEWEPARIMRSLLGWDPFREMAPFLADDRLPALYAPFEIKETKDAYVFRADVPGMKENDLEISLTGNRLTVSGKREAEKKEQTDTFYTYERTYGSFTRAFTLPDGASSEGATADLKDGVLSVSVPKKPEVQPKKIAINPAPGKPAPKA